MNVKPIVLSLTLLTLAATPTLADFKIGYQAYKKGDYNTALKEFRADKGAKAAYFLGTMFEEGRGVPQDPNMAASLYRKAADKGERAAQYNLAVFLFQGRGVKADKAEGVKYMKKAAKSGYPPAQSALGVLYQEGDGVKKDNAEAVKWIRKAAEQGYPAAQYNLGVLYFTGKVNYGSPSRKDAFKWIKLAADQGYPPAVEAMKGQSQ